MVRSSLPGVGTGLLLGSVVVGAAGWLGDQNRVSVLPRLALQIAAGVLLVYSLDAVDPSRSLGTALFGREVGVWVAVLAVVGVVWLINLYNFMDGVDGLAGVQAVVAGCALGALFTWAHDRELAWLSFALAAAALGFLLWNWPPAKIFLGDVGSGLIGFCFGALALAGSVRTGLPLVILLLPLGGFVADATWTLCERLFRGERVFEPHRTHLYQRLVVAGWSHAAVSSTAAALAVGLSALAWFGRLGSAQAAWAASFAVVSLIATGAVLNRAVRKARA